MPRLLPDLFTGKEGLDRLGLRVAAFPAPAGAPTKRNLGERGVWHTPRWGETVRSRPPGVCPLKTVAPRTWAAFQPRLAFPLATVNVLVQWHGFTPAVHRFVPLSLAEFSL